MDALTPAARAAATLLAEKEDLAREITDALYAEIPGLLERYGTTGRERCLEDMRYNLEHLVPAIDLGAPEMFAQYVRWLDRLLSARHVPTDLTRRSLELTEHAARSRLGPAEAEAMTSVMAAGLAALGGDATA